MFYYQLFNAISTIIMVYTILIVMRILLSWFRGAIDGKPWHYLCVITGPYLALFRGAAFLRRGGFDFTPLLAISVLNMLQMFFSRLAYSFALGVMISLKVILYIIIFCLWNTFSMLLVFFAILAGIRLITIYFLPNPASPILANLDRLVQPIVEIPLRFMPKKSSYQLILITTIVLLIAIVIIGNFSLTALNRFLGAF
ncbi:MAG: YggT family protein [Spirochaetales bacterium]|nr:YggT family protein [Spirochaetales bacterium]